MKITKPLLEDKLVAWARAYQYVLDELIASQPRLAPLHELRAAAARTAAVLIQGVDLGDRSTD